MSVHAESPLCVFVVGASLAATAIIVFAAVLFSAVSQARVSFHYIVISFSVWFCSLPVVVARRCWCWRIGRTIVRTIPAPLPVLSFLEFVSLSIYHFSCFDVFYSLPIAIATTGLATGWPQRLRPHFFGLRRGVTRCCRWLPGFPGGGSFAGMGLPGRGNGGNEDNDSVHLEWLYRLCLFLLSSL